MTVNEATDVILGIDPGVRVTGYGIVARAGPHPRFVEAGTIEGGPARLSLGARLRNLYLGMSSIVSEFQPGAVALEKLYSHYGHPETAILMGHARGVLYLAASLSEVEVFDYAATEVKASLTGNGRADKLQVRRAVRQLLDLDSDPEPPDVSDALAVAVCHHYRAGRPAGL